jgi:threonine/homoserine efflux transporter RhtA
MAVALELTGGIAEGFMSAARTSDTVLCALTAIVLSILLLMEAKTMMLNLGAAMHDIHCQDH